MKLQDFRKLKFSTKVGRIRTAAQCSRPARPEGCSCQAKDTDILRIALTIRQGDLLVYRDNRLHVPGWWRLSVGESQDVPRREATQETPRRPRKAANPPWTLRCAWPRTNEVVETADALLQAPEIA